MANVENPFDPADVEAVYHRSKGIPREAIKLCAMSVQYAAINNLKRIPGDLVELAAGDIVRTSEDGYAEPVTRPGAMSPSSRTPVILIRHGMADHAPLDASAEILLKQRREERWSGY